MRSIASEESVVALAAHVSMSSNHALPKQNFSRVTNGAKDGLSVDVNKLVARAETGAFRVFLSKTIIRLLELIPRNW